MKANLYCHEYSTLSDPSLWIWKMWKGSKWIPKIWYLKNKKYFLDHKKAFFLILEMLSFSKIYKLADTSFK